MSTLSAPSEIRYPDSDGQPMAENTLQFEWIVTLKGNLDAMYLDDPNVFVAGDLLWYPVEGDNRLRTAPDAMVVFGRPKGYRGSYMQWVENNVAPQIVFEVLSPGNRAGEMVRKFKFYEHYGVEEYYLIDPERLTLDVWMREDNELVPIENTGGWVSPRLSIRFELSDTALKVFRPDGSPFLSFTELSEALDRNQARADAEAERANTEAERANTEAERADAEAERANTEAERADTESARAERLAARLRELGESVD